MTTDLAVQQGAHHAGNAMTASEYIVHHLTHFSSAPQNSIVNFKIINIDTIFWSVLLGIIGLAIMWLAARRATAGVPGRFQAFVEMIVEMVEQQSQSIVHGDRTFIAPLALTVFVWVVLMNAMDFLPVDLFSYLFRFLNLDISYHRAVPTADLNGALGMALAVLALILFYNIKIKGWGGFVHELFCAPFGSNPFLWVPNFLLNIIEFAAKTVSLECGCLAICTPVSWFFYLLHCWAPRQPGGALECTS